MVLSWIVYAALLLGSSGILDAFPGSVAGSYIVVYKAEVDADRKTAELERYEGVRPDHRFGYAIKGFSAWLTLRQLASLRVDAQIDYVSEDAPVLIADATAPLVPGETVPTGVRRIEAATRSSVHSESSISVAVIDTGIDLTHPELNAVSGRSCVRPAGSAQDDNGHGTHVSGTIAAANQGRGIVGVSPGTRLYAVKVLDRTGVGTRAQLICGIDWLTANASRLNINVANLSLAASGRNDGTCGRTAHDPVHQAICRSVTVGITYVVAAGNGGMAFSDLVPAAYTEVLTVTAIADTDGEPGGYGGVATCSSAQMDDGVLPASNYALMDADIEHTIASPGACITSTFPGGRYAVLSGTSMAAAHVTGVVALCMGSGSSPGPCAESSPAEVIARLRADAARKSNSSGATPYYGFNGDPRSQLGDRYAGYLVWAGAY